MENANGRSREGAWIEIGICWQLFKARYCRSREGAWIEIKMILSANIAQQSRSREGAWIEMHNAHKLIMDALVAPARERGLK